MKNVIIGNKASSLALLLLIPLLFTGCIGGYDQPAVAPESGTRASITFVAAEYSSSTKPFFENLVRDFETRYPNIEIELHVINWDFLDAAYSSMISRNQPPDLLLSNSYAHFAKDGLLNNIEELLSPELKEKLYPFLFNTGKMDGVQYAVPYAATIRELYYNKDIFEDIGMEETPKTWEELENTARIIMDKTEAEGFGVDFTDNEIWAYLSYFFFGAGGGWMKDGKWAINSPQNVKGLTFLKELYEKGLTDAEPAVTTRDEKQRILGNGKLGMMISGNYFESVVPKEFPGLKWAKGPIPVKEGQTPLIHGVQDVMISFKTDHTNKEALSLFLDFLYEDARYEEFVLREGFLPAIRTVGEKLSSNDKIMKQNIDSIMNARFYPIDNPAWSAVRNATKSMGEAVLLGQMTPKQALDRLQQIALNKS
ncbi:extracellular solute-binding protein [Paenibacillus alkaliterrae]|uniref:extracellular solute-binding protein n=1 Tax=Paenibacillus alkaliterrae TaxID=320909 RepID=UPI001F213CBA|nr:extracellular solute-binding protein [Paenibacillus alkaliterrae]MCF2938003.1 extracellular solute-binding protein [Paenibacillus alkaliterrae]